MTQATALILLRHHRGIIADVNKLPAPDPDAEQLLRPYRESVTALERLLGKTKAASN